MDAPARSLGPPNEYLLGLSEPPDGPPPSEGPVQNVDILSIPATPVLLNTHNNLPEGDPLSSVQGVGSLNHLRESLQDFGVGVAAIVVRVLFPIPQTDRDRFGAVAGEERDLVLEAALLA